MPHSLPLQVALPLTTESQLRPHAPQLRGSSFMRTQALPQSS